MLTITCLCPHKYLTGINWTDSCSRPNPSLIWPIIIIIIHKFHRDASLEQNFRAAMCHVLHYRCNINATVADSLRCRMACGTVPSSVHAWMPSAMAATWSPAATHSKPLPRQRGRCDRRWYNVFSGMLNLALSIPAERQMAMDPRLTRIDLVLPDLDRRRNVTWDSCIHRGHNGVTQRSTRASRLWWWCSQAINHSQDIYKLDGAQWRTADWHASAGKVHLVSLWP